MLVVVLALAALAAPTTVVQQGRLLDVGGNPRTGSASVVFRLYPSESAAPGGHVWAEPAQSLTLEDGYYTAVLGNSTPLDTALLESNLQLWLEVEVGGQALPRQRLHAVPYAVNAGGARTLTRTDCTTGQVLTYDGDSWECTTPATGVQTFNNTTTSGWPGCGAATQKWTRIGDVVIYSVSCTSSITTSGTGGGSVQALYTNLGAPSWAIPTSTVRGTSVGLSDNASIPGGSNGSADGPYDRANLFSAQTDRYSINGMGSFGGTSWTTYGPPAFTAIYHVKLN
jgi:hypothetical protein